MKGFKNHGNTCYFNTALQCLLYIPILSNYFIREPYIGDCSFTIKYSELVKTYWTRGQETLRIGDLLSEFRKKFPRFGSREQHDVQEAVLCIIDILETSRPEIKKWFYGKKTQETIWPGGKSSSQEDFSVHLITSNGRDMGKLLSDSTDWNTIENFQDTEGKTHHVATTRMLFSNLPQVFMISFDRKSHVQVIENIQIGGSEYTWFRQLSTWDTRTTDTMWVSWSVEINGFSWMMILFRNTLYLTKLDIISWSTI